MGYWTIFGAEVSGRVTVLTIVFGIFALGANWRLFRKCEQPGWAVFVPGYNVVIAMRILGRPDWHAALFLVPVFNIYLLFKTTTELARAFGKNRSLDYLLAVVFNLFYIMNLSLTEDEEYQGPVYGAPQPEKSHGSGWAHA